MKTEIKPHLIKRIVLGKNKPSPFLRFICCFSMIWDVLLALYMLATAVIILIRGPQFPANSILQDFTAKFCFSYAILHGVSLLAAILLYRQKKIGFWLYLLSNVALVVSTFIFLKTLKADYIQITFTLFMIGLFGTQWKKLS